MPKIYTKVGDKGRTGLVGGQKIAKNDARLDAYGTVDELNSVLGLARVTVDRIARDRAKSGILVDRSFDSLMRLCGDLELVQNWLFDLGGLLASVPADRKKFKLAPMQDWQIRLLEERIDGATALLKPLREFILPGGSEAAAHLHVARTVCRRAERAIVAMKKDVPPNAVPFVNRLSDYLFTMARYCNYLLAVEDVAWSKAASSPSE
ncbi:MAG: cob(I)yrinic acid a,c-diamide adenosyltransferase [Deltaproteobacteria bacterium]|nr:cob(I)yrinic acid a,c-diamide adenosyltransferase [Deltaproteobacteria bacterium]